MKKIKPITLEIDEEDWKLFKENTSRTITLNNMLVLLIEESNRDKISVHTKYKPNINRVKRRLKEK